MFHLATSRMRKWRKWSTMQSRRLPVTGTAKMNGLKRIHGSPQTLKLSRMKWRQVSLDFIGSVCLNLLFRLKVTLGSGVPSSNLLRGQAKVARYHQALKGHHWKGLDRRGPRNQWLTLIMKICPCRMHLDRDSSIRKLPIILGVSSGSPLISHPPPSSLFYGLLFVTIFMSTFINSALSCRL
jgi:hypothetical protein